MPHHVCMQAVAHRLLAHQPTPARRPTRHLSTSPRLLPSCSARAAEEQLAAQLARLQAREAGLAAAVCQAQAENLQLRQALHVAKQAAEPSVVQLRQLLLDPAVNREFAGLRSELEARTRELAAAQRELAARQFGPDPLLARVNKLQAGPAAAPLLVAAACFLWCRGTCADRGRWWWRAAGTAAWGSVFVPSSLQRCLQQEAWLARTHRLHAARLGAQPDLPPWPAAWFASLLPLPCAPVAAPSAHPGPVAVPLQEENADLRRQVGESRAQQLERTVAAAREQLEDVRRVNAGGQGWGLAGPGTAWNSCAPRNAPFACAHCRAHSYLSSVHHPLSPGSNPSPCRSAADTQHLGVPAPAIACLLLPAIPLTSLSAPLLLLLLQSWSSTPSLWSCKRSSWRSSLCCPSMAAGQRSQRGGSSAGGGTKQRDGMPTLLAPAGVAEKCNKLSSPISFSAATQGSRNMSCRSCKAGGVRYRRFYPQLLVPLRATHFFTWHFHNQFTRQDCHFESCLIEDVRG